MKKIIVATGLAVCLGAAAFTACSADGTAFGLTKKEYSEIFGKTAEIMLGGTNTADADGGVTTYGYVVDPDDSFIKSSAAFVYFMSELYKNDKFELSEDPVKFTCSYGEDAFDISMLATCDKDKGLVTGEICGTEDFGSLHSEFYISLEVEYDFATETVTGFNIGQCGWNNDPAELYYESDYYSDGVIYHLAWEADEERANFIKQITAKKAAYDQKLENVKDLKADFTDEYTRSMAIVVS